MKGEIFFASLAINILALALPLAMLQVYDRILGSSGWGTAVALLSWVAVAITLEVFCRFGRSLLLANRAAEYELNAQFAGLQKLLRADFRAVEEKGSSRLLGFLEAPAKLRDLFSGQGYVALYDLPFALIFLALVFYIGGSLVLIPLGAFVLVLAFAATSGADFAERTRRFENADASRNWMLTRYFEAMEGVRAMAMESLLTGIVRGATQSREDAHEAMERKSLMLTEASRFLGQATSVLIIGFGCLKVLNGDLTVGGLTACAILGGRAIGPLTVALGMWTRLRSSKVALADQAELMELPETAVFEPDAEVTEVTGDIEFRNLVMKWSDWSMEELNVHIAAGGIVDMQGPRIAVSLAFLAAAGFDAPASGSVLIGGRELKDYDETAFRRSVVLIPNEPELFDGTLMENLTMFDPSREARAREWAGRIGLTDLIGHLPHGFLTKYRREIVSPINEGIVRRIALARALAMEPKVILVDHGFHNVDQPGERTIAEVLASLRGKVTVLFASDRAIFKEQATQAVEIKVRRMAPAQKEAA